MSSIQRYVQMANRSVNEQFVGVDGFADEDLSFAGDMGNWFANVKGDMTDPVDFFKDEMTKTDNWFGPTKNRRSF